MINFRVKSVELEPTFNEIDNKSKTAQEILGQTALNDMQPYVPMKSGALRSSGHIEDGGKKAVWEAYSWRGYPYGARQFNTQFSNYTTAGTGSRWDERAVGIHMSSWERTIGEVFK